MRKLFARPPGPRKKRGWLETLLRPSQDGAISENASAKINFYLYVLDKRSDGYHNLDTLIAFCNLRDRLNMRLVQSYALVSEGPFASQLPTPDNNLVTKAVHMIAAEIGEKPNILIELYKNIPVAAGLGGGSADVAACLRGLSRLWKFDLDDLDMIAVAEELGADVPACLISRPLYASGIGETIEMAPALPSCGLVMVNPNRLLTTKDVFDRLTETSLNRIPMQHFTEIPKDPVQFADLLRNYQNDLMGPATALEPEILNVFRALSRTEGCLLPRLSGSGPTCFGIFENKTSARHAADSLRKKHPGWWVEACTLD